MESNRLTIVQFRADGASRGADESTCTFTVHTVSGPLAVTLRVCGDAGVAAIICSFCETVKTDAAHTLESKVTDVIASWPPIVSNLNWNELTEYVPAYT